MQASDPLLPDADSQNCPFSLGEPVFRLLEATTSLIVFQIGQALSSLFAPHSNQSKPALPISSSGRNCKRLIGGKEKSRCQKFRREKKRSKVFLPIPLFLLGWEAGAGELMAVHQASCTFVSCLCAPTLPLLCSSLLRI